VVQCLLGAFIHYVKKKDRVRRPPQNYFHAVFGLLVITLALYQVRSGYNTEWPTTTGREPLPAGVDIIYWIWVVVCHFLTKMRYSVLHADSGNFQKLLPVSYGIGLAFLPKQFRSEKKALNDRQNNQYNENTYRMKQHPSR